MAQPSTSDQLIICADWKIRYGPSTHHNYSDRLLGDRAIDGRTALAKELAEERRELIAALGGESEVSPQELAIIDMIAQKRVRRRIAGQWALLNRDRLFDRRKKKMAPIALELEQMEEAEVRLLKELGLKRRAKPVKGLAELLATDPASSDQQDA